MKVNYFGRELILDDRTAMYGGSFNYDLSVYEVEKVQYILDHLSKIENPVLIDVGASTGSYSLLPTVLQNLNVHSFEPSKSFEVLKENILSNGIDGKVVLNNMAVSEIKGRELFYEVVSNNDSCLALSMLGGRPASHKRVREIMVEVISLDDYCVKIKADVIKIDVEGNELNVLKGAIKTIERDKPLIVFEKSIENISQYGYDPKQLTDLLEEIGYKCKELDGEIIATHN